MGDLLFLLLISVPFISILALVFNFFAKRGVNPYPDIPADASEEERERELTRQRLSVQGTYQMRECMRGRHIGP